MWYAVTRSGAAAGRRRRHPRIRRCGGREVFPREGCMKVLIVDDSDAALKQLKAGVQESGHSVAGTACNGEEAVARYRELRPDVVIMDMIMPRMNGLEALQAILAQDARARVVMTC